MGEKLTMRDISRREPRLELFTHSIPAFGSLLLKYRRNSATGTLEILLQSPRSLLGFLLGYF